MKKKCVLFSLIFSHLCFAENPYWQGTKKAFEGIGGGALYQFKNKSNLYYLPVATGSLLYAFEEDQRITRTYQRKEKNNIVDTIGELGPLISFPFVSAGFFYYGENFKSPKAKDFAVEVFSTMYLSLLESSVLSFTFNVHHRPKSIDLEFVDEAFRGNSSFPSGHVIPYYTLFFKTFQFYGPTWSVLPLALSYIASEQRMQDKKHYFSDLIGSFFLTAFASEGVRLYNSSDKNHPLYKWIFENDLKVGLLRYKRTWGPRVSFSF